MHPGGHRQRSDRNLQKFKSINAFLIPHRKLDGCLTLKKQIGINPILWQLARFLGLPGDLGARPGEELTDTTAQVHTIILKTQSYFSWFLDAIASHALVMSVSESVSEW